MKRLIMFNLPIKFSLNLLFVLLMTLSLPAKAVFVIDDVMEQSQLMQMYTTMVEQLQSMKAQQKSLSKLKALYKEANETYKFVKYFEANRIVKELQSQIEMVTGLDNMSDKTFEQKLDIVESEMDRRVSDAKTDEEKFRLQKRKGQLKRELLLLEMESLALTNTQAATKDISVRDANQITAQSTAQMAALAAAEAANLEKQKRANKLDRQNREDLFKSSGDIYHSLGQLD